MVQASELVAAARDADIVALSQLLAQLGDDKSVLNEAPADAADGFTALHEAAKAGHVSIVDLLVKSGADPLTRAGPSTKGAQALHVAMRAGHLSVVSALLAAGVSVDSQLLDGWTCAHFAILNSDVPMLSVLLKAGADLTIKTGPGFGMYAEATPAELASAQAIKSLIGTHLEMRKAALENARSD